MNQDMKLADGSIRVGAKVRPLGMRVCTGTIVGISLDGVILVKVRRPYFKTFELEVDQFIVLD